ncbi:uncharacterized protein BT62DRAFT_552983 [Guyanagaster necrorhizus]|uniref:C2H2-type domain-containing protein n=1 Tax=Guyanagaster necrorhizus TaxID=856835 RepID=A0A9P7VIF8_9AGAR|nr:uncharacterized protein BT62DRAFT_552983 [Guyanagaster necrorhizus MCA 3950]KAG7441173.1 hypothetical protein BT62DRAFT_552983 [Guyanagaster necrorhizus MCA 3950]
MKSKQSSNPRPFGCDTCEKSFGRDAELQRHKKLHFVGEARKEVIIQCPSYPTCTVEDVQKANIVSHIKRKHPELLDLICTLCKKSLYLAKDIAALAQHQKDVHSVFQAPLEGLESSPPLAPPSAVDSSPAPSTSFPLSLVREHDVSRSPSPQDNPVSASSPTVTSLPEELGRLLLHNGPEEYQLAAIRPSGPFAWHPDNMSNVPTIATVYDVLSDDYRNKRPDLFAPPPSLYGGSLSATVVSPVPVVAVNFQSLAQSPPTPPPTLPTPPPSPLPAARSSSQRNRSPTSLRWVVTSQPSPPTVTNDSRFCVRWLGDNVVSLRYDSEILPTP